MRAKKITTRLARSRTRRGFTLIELMISLVMGLIVALAAVALAKTATTTFHEQARSSLTEMSVRSGAERLRQDISRVAFMSTPNIATDNTIAHVVGGPNSRYTSFDALQGIRINVNGSAPNMTGGLGLTARNLLSPDSIDITGNLTTDDIYHGTITSGGSCQGQVVTLDPNSDAAVWSLIGPGAPDGGAFSAFQPVADSNFIARVTDANGCNHFVPICGVAFTNTGGVTRAQISLKADGNSRGVLYAVNGTSTANYSVDQSCGSSEGGDVAIAPVQHVRWALTPTPSGLDSDPTKNKFDLTRQFIDADNAVAGPPEIIAEYAVDLKFGIVVRDPVLAGQGQPSETVHDFDTDLGSGEINKTMNYVGDAGAGPQHVRSVRFRLVTRTSTPDREGDVQIGKPRKEDNPYLARYCMEDKALADCKSFARARTIVSEVALHNQARVFF